MIALIQRVSAGRVEVDGATVGEIAAGIVALIGVRRGDAPPAAERLLGRVLTYRIFPDECDRMNRSLQQIGGGLLLVPQFTLAADTRKGTRAGFQPAAPPEQARELFGWLVTRAQARHPHVAAGVFGAHMQLSLVNDGPVTFWLESGGEEAP